MLSSGQLTSRRFFSRILNVFPFIKKSMQEEELNITLIECQHWTFYIKNIDCWKGRYRRLKEMVLTERNHIWLSVPAFLTVVSNTVFTKEESPPQPQKECGKIASF